MSEDELDQNKRGTIMDEDDFVDDVIPHLTEEEVSGIMAKLQSIQLAKGG